MRKHILFVSIAFPPKNDPECLQAAKYFKYLSREDELTFTVLTSSSPTLFMPIDAELSKFSQGYQQQVELPIYESKYLNYLLRKVLPNGIDFPDSKFSFHWQVGKAIKKIQKWPQVIYSRSNPLSSAFMAYKLKKFYRVPWVMHLSDPWVDSPVHQYTLNQKKYHAKWEQVFFEEANAICLTSESTIEFYKKKFPHFSDKLHFSPNVYDSSELLNQDIDFGKKLRMVYAGGLAGKRSAFSILKAIEELAVQSPELTDIFEVTFVGSCDRENLNIFNRFKLKNVKYGFEKPYAEALKLIKEGHILINIDVPIAEPEMAMFFPSKLLDYFLAQRKILTITSPRSASEQVLKDLNSVIIRHHDIESIKQFVVLAIKAFQSRNQDFFLLKNVPGQYEAAVNAGKLAELLKSF